MKSKMRKVIKNNRRQAYNQSINITISIIIQKKRKKITTTVKKLKVK